MTPLPMRKVSKIAVFRPSALGDFVFCLPAVHALRSAYPTAEIVYLGKRWHADFLRGRPGPVDRVVVVPPVAGIGTSDASDKAPPDASDNAPPDASDNAPADASVEAKFTDAMRRERFDLAMQMYGGGRYANPLLQRFNARLTVGMRTPDAAPLGRCLPFGGLVNRRLQLLEIAALAGAQSWPMTSTLHATNLDRELAARLVPATPGKPLIMVQPGATDPRRRWPAKRFAAVADALAEEGAIVAVNGTQSEAPLVREVLETMRHDAVDLSGKATLSALCGLLERCTLIVANDTGPLHLALEIGTPGVGIYWFTNLVESAPLSQRGHRAAVSLRVNCPVCGLANVVQRCEHDVSFVDDVALEEVTALAIALYRESL